MVYTPEMVRIRQLFPAGRIISVGEELSEGFRNTGLLSTVLPGSRIAVTAGSRGISNIPLIIRTILDELKRAGAEPFVLPAMGSHGGGSEDGQLRILKSLGITERSVNAPIVPCVETVVIGAMADGTPVHFNRAAGDADGVVVVNRVKPHTAFHGEVESGLCKMVAVGLGGINGAETMHRRGLGPAIVESFRLASRTVRLICGVAVMENARDEIAALRVVPPEMFEQTDRELLDRCRAILPRIPVHSFDILIVDEMGKNISGTGMDTNVIGFWRRFGGERDPDYSTLIVLKLTPGSMGNAMGIGLADLTTRRLVEAMDARLTYANAMTSQWALGRIPITLENDRECIRAALAHHSPPETARIVRIKNTLELEYLWVSANLVSSLAGRKDIEIVGNTHPMVFDESGFLK